MKIAFYKWLPFNPFRRHFTFLDSCNKFCLAKTVCHFGALFFSSLLGDCSAFKFQWSAVLFNFHNCNYAEYYIYVCI